MSAIRLFVARLRNVLAPARAEQELARELAAHLALLEDEYRRRGMTAEDARRTARRAIGGVEQAKELQRDARSFRWLEETGRDIRYAVAALGRAPGFTTVAVLTLALGIGTTTAIFSVVRGFLLQPLPFKDADRIVQIVENIPADESFSGRPLRRPSMSQDDFDWWRRNTRTLSHMAVTMPETRTVMTSVGTERLAGARVSPALFPMRGVQPIVGRWLRPDEERPDAYVAVLGEATWRRYYGADAEVVGRSLVLDGLPYTIVGVMPEAFGGTAFWTPFAVEPPRPGTVQVIGVTSRLRDGVSLEEAAVEANAFGHRLRGVEPIPDAPPRFEVVGEHDQMVAAVRPALRVLVAAVAVVLLIVCANVANLLLARGTGRRQEIGIRRALGATRVRIMRQLLTEGVVLSLAGGVAGATFAYAGIALVRGWGVIDIPGRFRFALGRLGATILPRIDEIAVDPAVLAFAVGLSLVTGVVFGLAPALRLSRIDHHEVTSGGLTNRFGSSSSHTRAGHLLAGLQLALATALLVAAGLLVHSFVNLSSLPLGFDLDAQIFQLVAPGNYPPSRKIALAYEVHDRLRASPGIEAAGFTNMAQPLEADDDRTTIVPPGWQVNRADPGEEDRSERRDVTAEYLRALGVQLVEGRWFDERDTAGRGRVLLVNRTWVRRFSPHRSPISTTAMSLCRTLSRGCADTPYEIVGIVDDIRLRMDGGPGGQPASELPSTVFVELGQALPPPEVMDRPGRMDEHGGSGTSGGSSGAAFAVRSRTEPLTLADLRGAIRQVDPALAVEDFTTMGRVFSAITARPRFYAAVLTLFGAIAAFIAAIGVYGVLAYSISQRTQEFGIRLALGANPRQVLDLALRQGLLIVGIGIPAGVLGAMTISRFLSGMLFGLTPLDATTYVVVAIGFAAVAMFASYVPARRATQVNPLVALRYE